MKTLLLPIMLLTSVLTGLHPTAHGQEKINWLTFEQLEDSLRLAPKKVFIDFYTDWCTYCKKMDKKVFTDAAVITTINREYYAVRMDAETRDTVRFDGLDLVNHQATDKRPGIHDLALLLGGRNGKFTPPTLILLDEAFRVIDRRFEYQHREKLLHWLQQDAALSR
ncbi:thioredoxin family protein [Echinicola vietnamensis]|uniref:Thiol:disulfide interchange protein n=1 Tax=Echinicola vietnamensis (strain DSM 17526 / LMG 23754 / KMM 6221) TaxID=926556 RepID=L0G5D9_ECHVK|nr:thioredoxin family protein [Echinicola vietnamensis]AGA80236.1 thiol:disulfide interchange protein [Echinicola vietnamensis DSM 17526]